MARDEQSGSWAVLRARAALCLANAGEYRLRVSAASPHGRGLQSKERREPRTSYALEVSGAPLSVLR